MTMEALVPWLFGRTAGGIRWGLERTEELLAGVDDPHRRFASIHIGGTNGKGSVAALSEAALRVGPGGLKVGLYTSPHLVSFSERIRVDGVPVSAEMVVASAERLRPEIERTGATFFEATTAIAFLCFAEAGVDLAIIEVGLGGRLDATNVIEPLVTVVTNVAREHTEFLGSSIKEIAGEKAGIFKPGVPAITAERDQPAVGVLESAAAHAGAPLTHLDRVVQLSGFVQNPENIHLRLRSTYWGARDLEVALLGKHQARNALVAAEALALLPPELRPEWTQLEAGFASVRWPGRLQVQTIRGTTLLFDVAHNPAGVETLDRALDSMALPEPLVAVIGILSDKEWKLMLAPLAARAVAIVLTVPYSAPPDRRWDPRAVAEWIMAHYGADVRVIPDLESAVQRATTLAPHGTVLVTGSFHTVGDAMKVLDIPPFPETRLGG